MRFRKRLGPGLVSLSAAAAAVAICGLQPVAGQALQETAKKLVIYDVVGPDTVSVGDMETYRARINQTRDVEFRWTANGSTSLGNPVVHRFPRPGKFEVIVTARNVVSTVSDTFTVTVLGPEPPPVASMPNETEPGAEQPGDGSAATTDTPASSSGAAATLEPAAASAAGSPRSGFRGQGGGRVNENAAGYSWVIATYFQRSSAVALANSYRASGYKASVVEDRSGQGSEVFRVILGEFSTEQSALRAKPHLIRAGHKNVLLRELGGRG